MTSDARSDEDDEDRWLVSRERGEPGPAVPEPTAAGYAKLQSLLEDLPAVPAGVRLRHDWHQSVLDAIDRGDADAGAASTPPEIRPIDTARPRRTGSQRRIAIVASGLAVAAGVAIVLRMRPPAPAPETDAELSITPAATQGSTRTVHELIARGKAVVRGVIEGPGELRVYDDSDVELARCGATGPACAIDRSGKRSELLLELLLPAPGPLHIVLLSAPLAGPSRGRAADLAAAHGAGIVMKPLDATVR